MQCRAVMRACPDDLISRPILFFLGGWLVLNTFNTTQHALVIIILPHNMDGVTRAAF